MAARIGARCGVGVPASFGPSTSIADDRPFGKGRVSGRSQHRATLAAVAAETVTLVVGVAAAVAMLTVGALRYFKTDALRPLICSLRRQRVGFPGQDS